MWRACRLAGRAACRTNELEAVSRRAEEEIMVKTGCSPIQLPGLAAPEKIADHDARGLQAADPANPAAAAPAAPPRAPPRAARRRGSGGGNWCRRPPRSRPACLRTAGSRLSSAICIDTSWWLRLVAEAAGHAAAAALDQLGLRAGDQLEHIQDRASPRRRPSGGSGRAAARGWSSGLQPAP